MKSVAAVFFVAALGAGAVPAGAKSAVPAWVVVPSPSPGNTIDSLNGVSCVSASSCVAVGSNWKAVAQTLVESWDGSNWTVVASPNQGTSDN